MKRKTIVGLLVIIILAVFTACDFNLKVKPLDVPSEVVSEFGNEVVFSVLNCTDFVYGKIYGDSPEEIEEHLRTMFDLSEDDEVVLEVTESSISFTVPFRMNGHSQSSFDVKITDIDYSQREPGGYVQYMYFNLHLTMPVQEFECTYEYKDTEQEQSVRLKLLKLFVLGAQFKTEEVQKYIDDNLHDIVFAVVC